MTNATPEARTYTAGLPKADLLVYLLASESVPTVLEL